MHETDKKSTTSRTGQPTECVMCGSCRSVCPLVQLTGDERLSARAKLALMQEAELEPQGEQLLQTCLLCGACREKCPHRIDTPALLLARRIKDKQSLAAKLYARSLRRHPLIEQMVRQLSRLEQPAGTDQARKKAPKPAQKKIDTLLFHGCQTNLYPDLAASALKVCEILGMQAATPSDQVCCGLPLLSIGEFQLARKAVLKNLEHFEQNGTTVFSNCSSCTHAIRSLWPMLFRQDKPELKERVEKFSASVGDLFLYLVEKQVMFDIAPKNEKVSFHLPCHLRNGPGSAQQVYDYMQKLLGPHFVVPADQQQCCGFGGTFSLSEPQLSGAILEKRVAELANTKASTIITPCPGCRHHLQRGFSAKGLEIQVEHPISWLARKGQAAC